jgi:hypothetical protein
MKHGGKDELSVCASAIAKFIPQDEAFPFLASQFKQARLGEEESFCHALAQLDPKSAAPIIKKRFEALVDAALGSDKTAQAHKLSRLRYKAWCCLYSLLLTDVLPSDISDEVTRLLNQPFAPEESYVRKRAIEKWQDRKAAQEKTVTDQTDAE